MKKRIKIFAAFGKDVDEDVVRFGDFLCTLNAQSRDIEVSIFKNEKKLSESLEQSKEQIDSELEACDFFLLILGGKKDEYALDKLNKAIEQYAKTKPNPDIHIFVNMAKDGADYVRRYFSHDKKYEHFVEQFNYNDTLKTKFLIWLSAKQKDFSYEIDKDIHGAPVIKVGGIPVSGLIDFEALKNNDDYQTAKGKLIQKLVERERCLEKLHRAGEKDQELLNDDIIYLAEEIKELQDIIDKMEKYTLKLYQNYANMTLNTGYDVKLKRAYEWLESGKLDRARKELDVEGIKISLNVKLSRIENLTNEIEAEKEISRKEINLLFTDIDFLKLDIKNKNRFEEIEKFYLDIEKYQEKLNLDMTVLFDYADFLDRQNRHDAAMIKYTQNLARCKELAKINPNAYLPELASTLNNLAILQAGNNLYTEAETNYGEALNIGHKLAKNNLDIHLPELASTLNNLANLQKNTNRHAEAEINHVEALNIRRKLTKNNPDVYLPHLASTLNNLANLQAATKRYVEAETNYIEALNIRRKLAENNLDAYLSDLANTLNGLAGLQVETNRNVEAETNHVEALNIWRKLTETNPSAYLPSLAIALNNLASLQLKTNRYAEAEANYGKALTVYRKLTENNPDAYSQNLASILDNLASLQLKTNRYAEAETNYSKALIVYRKLTKTNPNTHLLNVARILNNLANLQRESSRYTEAEGNYAEALKICLKLVETHSDIYLSHAFGVIKNLVYVKERLSKYKEIEELKNMLSQMENKS